MAYSYDEPLVSQHLVAAATDFANQAAVTLPCQMVAALAHGNGSRVLEEATVLGVRGIVTTVGTGTISIGDGSDVDRYGVFTIDDGVALNGALIGTLVLTEEGFRMGVSNDTVPSTFVLTFAGTAEVANLTVVLGHF